MEWKPFVSISNRGLKCMIAGTKGESHSSVEGGVCVVLITEKEEAGHDDEC